MRRGSLIIILFICSCACVQKPPGYAHSDSVQGTGISQPDTVKSIAGTADTVKNDLPEQHAAGKIDLYFRPYSYELTGILTTETFYGPPNYGDDPAHDSKENFYMLNLDEPVNVLVHPGDENNPLHDFDAPVTGIQKLEVAYDGGDSLLRPYLNKRVTLKGELFGAFNGHHHTDVLISVSEIVK